MKNIYVFGISFILSIFLLAGCSSFIQDIKTISNNNECTVSFLAPGCEGKMDSIKAQYQEKITLPDCTFKSPNVSLIFAGWAIDADKTQVFYPENGEIEVTEDISLYAVWMDKDLTRYKVIHLFQNVNDDNYTENKKLAQDLWGYNDTLTEAKALDVYGFTAQSFEQIIIEHNAKPVQEIQIKYTRKEFTISFDHNGDFDDTPTMDNDSITARYQKMVTLPDCQFKIHESKKFAGWSEIKDKNDDIEFINDETIEVTRDMILYAHSEPVGTSEYMVKHLFQNIDDDGYTEDTHNHPHQIFEGPDNKIIKNDIEPLSIPGFEVYEFDPPLTDQLKIEEDDGKGPKTIIKIKYNRKPVTLTFDLAGGIMTSPVRDNTMTSDPVLSDGKLVLSLKYGAAVPTPVVEKTHHKLTSWTPALPPVAVENGHYTAGWEESYTYIPGAEGGLSGTSTKKQGAVAKASIIVDNKEIPNTADIYVVPEGTVAHIDTDGSLIWYPDGLNKNEEIHVHGAFHHGRKIQLSPYIISQYPVTLELYESVMGAHKFDTSRNPMQPYASDPVNNVTWYDAVIFCNKLSISEGLEPVYYYINEHGIKTTDPKYWAPADYPKIRGDHKKNGYRLPTNAEWEFAARGGNPSAESWQDAFSGAKLAGAKLDTTYEQDDNLSTVAYYKKNTNQQGPCNVGQKLPNELHLFDMSGGICEWTYDFMNEDFSFDDTPYIVNNIVVDPMGTEKGTLHSLRGGSYFSSAFYCSVTYILSTKKDTLATSRKHSYGLRLCRNAE